MPSRRPDPMQHIWLPYAQMKTAAPPLPVATVEGCRITLEDGRELIDGIASWWTACHGYRHPHIVKSVEQQLRTLPHVMFGGLAHDPALTLAARLAGMAPSGLNHVFFADSGSVSVEVAMKMALQYWRNKGVNGKTKFVAFKNGYHGDTIGAMSVSDPEEGMHRIFRGLLPMQYTMEIPSGEYGLAEFTEMLKGIAHHTAALIIEPLVQCAGGMRFHGADVLAEIHRLCKEHDILFIADEIATGFYRTGSMFACNEAGITPDILCLGKALTGGTMTLAATVATDEVFNAFYDDDPDKALMHGPTYMANPLACAAANASLDLFEKEPRLKQVEAIELQLLNELEPCREIPGVIDVRVKGAIGVVELKDGIADPQALRRAFVERGVWIRPIGNVIYLMPPFVITKDELSQLTDAIKAVLLKGSNRKGPE